MDLYKAGKLKLEELVTRRWRLEQINEAYAQMLTGDVRAALLCFDIGGATKQTNPPLSLQCDLESR